MRTLHMNEVLQHVDQSIAKRKTQRDQVHKVWESVNNVIKTKEFEGAAADAIRNNYSAVQLPATSILYFILDQWVEKMKRFKEELLSFDREDSIYNEELVTQEIKSSLHNVEQYTLDIISEINKHHSAISHLTSTFDVTTNGFTQSHWQLKELIETDHTAFEETDNRNKESLTGLKEELANLKALLSNIQSWHSKGLSYDPDTIKKISGFVRETEELSDLYSKALELAKKNGDEALENKGPNQVKQEGEMKNMLSLLQHASSVAILGTKALKLTFDGSKIIVEAGDRWVNKDGKYKSSLASAINNFFNFNVNPANANQWASKKISDAYAKTTRFIHQNKLSEKHFSMTAALANGATKTFNTATKFGSAVINFVPNTFRDIFDNKPENVLKSLSPFRSLAGKTFLEINNTYHDLIRFDLVGTGDNAKAIFNGKDTMKKITSTLKPKTLLKKLPYVGILTSVGLNIHEAKNPEHAHKSGLEKGMRVAAGIGTDIGVAALTTGGATIGTMICPGVGTVIGGAVGAGIGIVGSIALGDEIKDLGEKAGRGIRELGKKTAEGFKVLGSIFK